MDEKHFLVDLPPTAVRLTDECGRPECHWPRRAEGKHGRRRKARQKSPPCHSVPRRCFDLHGALAGKTVVPFATSGSSGMGDSSDNLQALAPAAKVVEGRRFPASVSADALKTWAEGF
ncbi:MAG: hypothetical protein ILO10_06655 [Kiritimatiellae bacterium]|nr:hypothetical protein [Kiritimatiellia bacterium]